VGIPGLDMSYANDTHGIASGEMKLKSRELHSLFDAQISQLFCLIDERIRSFQSAYPADRISHLVLSGGLGNNAYVQKRLIERYANGKDTFGKPMKVSISSDPQLAVCKGIVSDRVRKLSSGKAVLGWRCARASYGTLCKIRFNKENQQHIGRATRRDIHDGKDYIHDTIAWFIRKVRHSRTVRRKSLSSFRANL
jgi:hypothetical protein